jgi:hypothetical protein
MEREKQKKVAVSYTSPVLLKVKRKFLNKCDKKKWESKAKEKYKIEQ